MCKTWWNYQYPGSSAKLSNNELKTQPNPTSIERWQLKPFPLQRFCVILTKTMHQRMSASGKERDVRINYCSDGLPGLVQFLSRRKQLRLICTCVWGEACGLGKLLLQEREFCATQGRAA